MVCMQQKYILGIAYMLSMGSCGIVLVAIGSSLDDLAQASKHRSVEVGNVFISRGVGSIAGAIISARLYSSYPGHAVMTTSLLSVVILLSILPLNVTLLGLHVLFLCLGLQTSIIDTGCQILTRKLHGKSAGPWLGANTVAFGLSAALVPVLEIYVTDLCWQYAVLAFYITIVAAVIAYEAIDEFRNSKPLHPEISLTISPFDGDTNAGYSSVEDLSLQMPKSHISTAENDWIYQDITSNSSEPPRCDVDFLYQGAADEPLDPPHYYVEMIVAIMAFSFIGGSVAATAYMEAYLDEIGYLTKGSKAKLLLFFWLAITLGRILGVQDQRFLNNTTLIAHLSILCIGGILSMLLILMFQSGVLTLWIGVTLFGLFHGPCIGYCYDLNNRLTYPTEKSMSIVMFGLNCGASFVPYLTTFWWRHGGGSQALIFVLLLSMAIPLPLIFLANGMRYEAAACSPRHMTSEDERERAISLPRPRSY